MEKTEKSTHLSFGDEKKKERFLESIFLLRDLSAVLINFSLPLLSIIFSFSYPPSFISMFLLYACSNFTRNDSIIFFIKKYVRFMNITNEAHGNTCAPQTQRPCVCARMRIFLRDEVRIHCAVVRSSCALAAQRVNMPRAGIYNSQPHNFINSSC